MARKKKEDRRPSRNRLNKIEIKQWRKQFREPGAVALPAGTRWSPKTKMVNTIVAWIARGEPIAETSLKIKSTVARRTRRLQEAIKRKFDPKIIQMERNLLNDSQLELIAFERFRHTHRTMDDYMGFLSDHIPHAIGEITLARRRVEREQGIDSYDLRYQMGRFIRSLTEHPDKISLDEAVAEAQRQSQLFSLYGRIITKMKLSVPEKYQIMVQREEMFFRKLIPELKRIPDMNPFERKEFMRYAEKKEREE